VRGGQATVGQVSAALNRRRRSGLTQNGGRAARHHVVTLHGSPAYTPPLLLDGLGGLAQTDAVLFDTLNGVQREIVVLALGFGVRLRQLDLVALDLVHRSYGLTVRPVAALEETA